MDFLSLMTAVGRDLGVEINMQEGGTLSLQYDEGRLLHLEHDVERNLLHVYSVLGPEPSDNQTRLSVYRLLLQANAFDEGTVHASFALDEANSELLLTRQLDLSMCDATAVLNATRAIADTADLWWRRFSQPVSSGSGGKLSGHSASGCTA